MAVYAIYAYDNMFAGYHGISNWDLYECDNESEANYIGEELSYDVIDTYVTDRLYEDARAEADMDDDIDVDEAYEEMREEDAAWLFSKLKDDKTIEEYRQIAKDQNLSYERMVELYGD